MNALTFDLFDRLPQLSDDAATLPAMTAAEFLTGQEKWAGAVTSFCRLPKPVIAAVNGAARRPRELAPEGDR